MTQTTLPSTATGRRFRPSRALSFLIVGLLLAVLLVLFLFSQRTLVSGMLAGATKE